jgi:solute carrier family 25 phosphate transporter 3
MGLWKGLNQRMLMVGTLTAFQWFIYDKVKTAFGLESSGGIKSSKPSDVDEKEEEIDEYIS